MDDARNTEQETLQRGLRELVSKVPPEIRSGRRGEVVLRLSGKGGGLFRIREGRDDVEVSPAGEAVPNPLIEVIGDAEAIQAILDQKVDAREKFIEGGIRVRGDLQFLSDVILELGLLKHPL